ncbi:unnamed protein product [Adineta steineri]|uniref:Uncharacterized protein n=1 Tax=Adineta steineri TaxID=433720 RepID=A0A814MZZ5_9BILA|nr:unnamed protein product [Adineta steineri]CAF1175201.1 unnamed protein product [Adineta steineri]
MLLRQLLFLILTQLVLLYSFTEDQWNSFDAYGVKLATNDGVVAQARNQDAQFVLQFAPFNPSNLSSPCYIDYPGVVTGNRNFIYSIDVPKVVSNDVSMVFIGENINNSTSSYPFVGHLLANLSCQTTYNMYYFVPFGHDEFFVQSVDPSGQVAYGFSSRFAFSYDLQTHNVTYLSQWPLANFTPHAVDVSSSHMAIIAGFISDSQNKYKPIVYMLQMNRSFFTIIDTWSYIPSNSSWQATTSNRDASSFTRKHIMSVSMHDNTSAVLVGMPSYNIVFWFSMATTNLSLLASRDNGYHRGYGQSLGWSDEDGGPYPVILGNTYTFPYQWSSSIIYWFYWYQFISSDPIMPLYPTVQCPQWVDLGKHLITIAMSTLNLVLLDSVGQIYVMLQAPTGSYPDTSVAIGSNPTFSDFILCPVGTYKYWVGIYICYPCTMGTMTTVEGSTGCLPYDCDGENSFCPLGSITNDTYSDMITFVSQELSYPKSPESTIFDDILIQNMFTLGGSSHCLLVSPTFWVIVVSGFIMLILLIMGILKLSKQHHETRLLIKHIFRRADLINEGELWVGGLASIALIVLLIFAYHFSQSYLHQYPIETTSPSTFACDDTLRNAKFDTNLQSLSTPRNEEEQPMFDLLEQQQFILTIDFINTQQTCDDVEVTQTIHAYSKAISSNCSYNRSILTISTVLQSHTIELNYDFTYARSIGGFRVRFYGQQLESRNSSSNIHYLVRELNFIQPFLNNNQTMAYDPNIEFELIRVINQTDSLDDNGETDYNALWSLISLTSTSDLFLTYDNYMYYGLLKTSFSISLSETTYFIMNHQQPIVKQAEVIFHNLLFTIVCLELFGLLFIAIKLIGLPLFNRIRRLVKKHSSKIYPEHSTESLCPSPQLEDYTTPV